MESRWYKLFIYVSLIFVIIALIRSQYLHIPRIHSPLLMFISILCLVVGFLANALAHQRLLMTAHINIRFNRAVGMIGLNIFGKYIPGKVWVIMGRALYVAEKLDLPVAEVSFILLKGQLISIWCGLAFGICGLIAIDALHLMSWLGFGFFALFTLVLFSEKAQTVSLQALSKMLKKTYNLPVIDLPTSVALTPWFVSGWLLWGIGFFLMAQSLTDQTVAVTTVFCFPLASTLGILFVIAPGGIGIRESIITGYLVLVNIPVAEAVTVSAVSRLWFLVGEFLFFGLGYFSGKENKPVSNNTAARVNDE